MVRAAVEFMPLKPERTPVVLIVKALPLFARVPEPERVPERVIG
jgi:hypothetical protein